jgi:hypothetical protein
MPEGEPERWLMTIRVEQGSPGRWAVRWEGRILNVRTMEWEFSEPLNSSRTDEWLSDHRTDLTAALALAHYLAPRLRLMGKGVDEFIEWHHQPST